MRVYSLKPSNTPTLVRVWEASISSDGRAVARIAGTADVALLFFQAGHRLGTISKGAEDLARAIGWRSGCVEFSSMTTEQWDALTEAISRIAPATVAPVDGESNSELLLFEEQGPEPRSPAEIASAIMELIDKVWYHRHQVTKQKIERGQIKIVEKETYPRPTRGRETMQRDVWEDAKRSAERIEKQYGAEKLGPWSQFEWGMMNGKLSALRWVEGDEWDSLYT